VIGKDKNVRNEAEDFDETEQAGEVDVDREEGAHAAADSPGDGDIETLQEEIGRLREAMLRMQADTENTRKRLTRELERSRKLALERIMKDLLQVRDTLERGLDVDAESATVQSLLEGQQLTLKMFNKVLEDHHLEVIDPVGEAFDPELHEAMTVLPSAAHDENTVLEVLQKGFRLHERLIRPAMVVVSRKP
jgi:molecular chaperone GrpE